MRLPLADRLIPIIADEHSDPEKGTGAVKITPGHDFNDFQVGKRHNLPLINILTVEAKLNDSVPETYRGLDRFEARKRIVADLEEMGLLDKAEDITHAVPHDEKTKTVVLEPYLTEQWYLNVEPLAADAIKAVEDGKTRFVARTMAQRLFQLDAQHPAVVHLAPAVVGPPDSRRGTTPTARSSSPRPKKK